jgi:hypothetical protein
VSSGFVLTCAGGFSFDGSGKQRRVLPTAGCTAVLRKHLLKGADGILVGFAHAPAFVPSTQLVTPVGRNPCIPAALDAAINVAIGSVVPDE